jgi:type I restriction enzyme S subunit
MSNGIRPSQWRLEPERFEDLVVFLPPISEQTAICKHIDLVTMRLDQLIERIETAISFLKEYRTALISAAVTGKNDVTKSVVRRSLAVRTLLMRPLA